MGTAAALLAALAIRAAFAESLPKAVGDELYVPGMLMASFSVPLTSNETFAFDVKARDASPLPLVIMVLDPTDPFTSFMARDNASLDRFITTDESLDNSTFLFLEHARGEAAALEARLAARMDALGLPDGARAAWRRRLVFANFTTVVWYSLHGISYVIQIAEGGGGDAWNGQSVSWARHCRGSFIW